MQEFCIKVHILKFIFEQSSTMKVPYPHDEEIIVAKWMILTRLSLSATRQHWWSSHHDSPNYVNLRYPKYFRNFVEHLNCWQVESRLNYASRIVQDRIEVTDQIDISRHKTEFTSCLKFKSIIRANLRFTAAIQFDITTNKSSIPSKASLYAFEHEFKKIRIGTQKLLCGNVTKFPIIVFSTLELV